MLSLFLGVAGCTCSSPAPVCADIDGDGVTACAGDCDDGNQGVGPSAREACGDGKDNNCDGKVDEGCGCIPGAAPRECGAAGSPCRQECLSSGTLGACQPPSGPVDTAGDVNNCGSCGNVCPAALHAEARCQMGGCGRGPCEKGWFDFDGAKTHGCEARCEGHACVDGERSFSIDSEPVPETGGTFHAFSSGSAVGAAVQTSPGYTNMGVLGETAGGVVVQTSRSFQHYGGFIAAEQ